jgi:hypothetical protein
MSHLVLAEADILAARQLLLVLPNADGRPVMQDLYGTVSHKSALCKTVLGKSVTPQI